MNPAAERGARRWRAGTLTYTSAGLVGLFFWLLGGDFGFYLKERAVPFLLQLLLRQYHVSDLFAGFLLMGLPQLFVLLIGPVVAYHSDRHRGRWGRRIPFLFFPTPFAVLAMVTLAFGPRIGGALHTALGAHSPGHDASVVLVLAAAWALFELCAIVCNAVFISLITDVVPRGVIGRFFGMFRTMSLLAGILFSYFLLERVERHAELIFLGVGAVYAVSFTAMCLKVKEGAYPPRAPVERRPQGLTSRAQGMATAIRTYVEDCFSIPYYRWVFLSFALSVTANVPPTLFTLYFAQSLKVSLATLGKLTALQLVLSLIQAYPIGWLADRFHPLRMTMISLGLIVLSTGLAFFLVKDATSFGIAYVLCGTLWGFWGTSAAGLPSVLLDRSRFATLDSARTACGAVGQMLIGPICGWSFDLLDHEYRYIYFWTFGFAAFALLATIVVYRRFMALGGPGHYVAPE